MQPKNHINSLDGWRGIACLMVFFFHFALNLNFWGITIYGSVGVHLFFVLSGYLLYKQFVKKIDTTDQLPSIPKFYLRRFLRIYPSYLISILVFTAARYAIGVKPPDPTAILSHLLLIQNYFGSGQFYSISPVVWSLAIEFQFYILLPIFTVIFYNLIKDSKLRLILPILAMFLIGIGSRAIEYFYFNDAAEVAIAIRYRSIFSYLDLFSMGMLVAYLEHFFKDKFSAGYKFAEAFVLLLGGLLIILVNAFGCFEKPNCSALDVIFFPLCSCLAIAVILLGLVLFRQGVLAKILSFPPLVFVGTVSYSLYLYHVAVQLVLNLILGKLHMAPPNYVSALIVLVPAILISFLMYKFVEEPSLAWAAQHKDV